MKKLLSLFSLMCFAYFATAQISGSNNIYEVGGNTGIGISNPKARLQVGSAFSVYEDGDWQLIGFNWASSFLSNSSERKHAAYFKFNSDDGEMDFNISKTHYQHPSRIMTLNKIGLGIGVDPTSPLNIKKENRQINFLNSSNTALYSLDIDLLNNWVSFDNNSSKGFNFKNNHDDLMTISPEGYIGIGTTSPSSILHIFDNPSSKTFKVSLPSTSTRYNLDLRLEDIGVVFITDANTKGYYFSDRDKNLMSITSNGYVGIGTQTPSEKLHIKDGNALIENGDLKFINGKVNFANSKIGIGTSNPSEELHIKNGNAMIEGGSMYFNYFDSYNWDDENNTNQRIIKIGSGTARRAGHSDPEKGLRFSWVNSSLNETDNIMMFNKFGGVMIGGDRYKYGYELSVNGEIVCEELLVELKSDWADYVFDDDYNLLSLKETESFIKKHKHLPGIPSNVDIKEKGGIEIGEMQKLQMEKIEELTLHLINTKKENEDLIKRIEKMESIIQEYISK